MENYIENLMNQMIDDINRQKGEVVRQRLVFHNLIHLLDEKNEDNRFKRLLWEDHPDREDVYVDNGTKEGLLLVTFYKPVFKFENKEDDLRQCATINYKIPASISYTSMGPIDLTSFKKE